MSKINSKAIRIAKKKVNDPNKDFNVAWINKPFQFREWPRAKRKKKNGTN